MAKVTTVQQARDIAQLSYNTGSLARSIQALKVPKKISPYLSKFDIGDVTHQGYSDGHSRNVIDHLNEEDCEEINRFIINKARRRLKLNREKLADMGIEPEE